MLSFTIYSHIYLLEEVFMAYYLLAITQRLKII